VGHVRIEALQLPIAVIQPAEQGIELPDDGLQFQDLPRPVQPLAQRRSPEVLELLTEMAQRCQAHPHQPGSSGRDDQGPEHRGQTKDPPQLEQQRVVPRGTQGDLGPPALDHGSRGCTD
jgi:hypothetical protein